jgi:cell wall-associated NlpC family hydrolase
MKILGIRDGKSSLFLYLRVERVIIMTIFCRERSKIPLRRTGAESLLLTMDFFFMRHHLLLRSGTIACSALLVSGWMQPSASEPKDQPCPLTPADGNPSDSTKSLDACGQKTPIAPSLPEQLLNFPWNQTSNQLPKELETLYSDTLAQAQALAEKNQFAQAIAQSSGIPKNSSSYDTAQKLHDEWGQELLRQATSHYQKANLIPAIALLNAIPRHHQLYQQATELKLLWKPQLATLNRAIAAQNGGDWQGAIRNAQVLEGTPIYHSVIVQGLIQNATIQRYEPSAVLVQVATADLPSMQPAIAPPNSMNVTRR